MEIKRYNQIDILKGFAIILVLISHSIPNNKWKFDIFIYFHIYQAVPIFIILLAINNGLSFRKKSYLKLNQLYQKHYFIGKFKRLFLVLIFLYLFVLISNINIFFIGFGHYFIIILIQFIFIFPLIYYNYQKNPKLTIIICFLIDFLFQISFNYFYDKIFHIIYINEIFKSSIFRYFSFIIIGLYILDKYDNDKSLKIFLNNNKILYVLIPLSFLYLSFHYLIKNNFMEFLVYINYYETIFSVFYSCFIVLIGLAYLPKQSKNQFYKFLQYIGKSSLHIFIFQIIFCYLIHTYTPELYSKNVLYMLIAVFITLTYCILIGILWYSIEVKLLNKSEN